jgi:putative tricarboxylic transport membrane protein
MLVSQGDLRIMVSNPLVGTITGLALLLLVWPLISMAVARVRKPKPTGFAAEQPVD